MITKGSYSRWRAARMPRGWLVRIWSMGGSGGKESSGLAVMVCVSCRGLVYIL